MATPTEFGPKRLPIWAARITGGASCAAALILLFLAFVNRREFLSEGVFLIFAAATATYAAWTLHHASQLSRLRAVLLPGSLRLEAPLLSQRRVISSEIPWAAVDGLADVNILNPSCPRGTQTVCILYTRRGQFALDERHWKDLAGFRREMAVRIGSAEIAPDRSAALDGVLSVRRRVYFQQRQLGRIVTAISLPLFVMAFTGGFFAGFSADLYRGLLFLFFAFSLGIAMVRFYRHDGGLPGVPHPPNRGSRVVSRRKAWRPTL